MNHTGCYISRQPADTYEKPDPYPVKTNLTGRSS